MSLADKLKRYIISRDKYPDVPSSLDGEILLEEVRDAAGNILGWITVSSEALEQILRMRDNPTLRPNVTIPDGKYKGRNLRTLTRDEFEELMGYKKYFDRWRREGIKI
jgi:hypothetical protein